MKIKNPIQTFGKWSVTKYGLEGEVYPGYVYDISADRLSERWDCHMWESKGEHWRGPIEDFEAALSAARQYHETPSARLKCYCGRHR